MCAHHSPAHTRAVRPRVPSEYSPSPLREGVVPYRRRRAMPWYVRTRCASCGSGCEHRTSAAFHRRARTLAARVRACESLVSFRVSVHVLWKVCAHSWSTFRRPGTKRARVQHPLEYPCPVPSRAKTPCGHRVLCWCECVARTDAYASQCTAGRTIHVAGLSPRTCSTARSPPRCRRSISCNSCAPAARAMPSRAPACERPGPLVFRKHPCVRVHAPSHCRARALAAPGQVYAGSSPRSGAAPWGTRYRLQYPSHTRTL